MVESSLPTIGGARAEVEPMGDSLFLTFLFPGHTEWVVLLILGLLIFGRRLPEIGRSLGRGIVEFKRGIKGIEDDVEDESSRPTRLPDASRQASAPAVEPTEAMEKVEAGSTTEAAGADEEKTAG